jgi:hypothetical protein
MSTIEFFKRKPGYCGAKDLIPPLKVLEKTQTGFELRPKVGDGMKG